MTAHPTTWMPMFWGDYLRDTMDLSTEEHGAYLLMIGHYWCNGGPIPADPKHFQRVTKCNNRNAKAVYERIARFFVVSEGRFVHPRIDTELATALERKKNRVRASEAANAAKASKSATDSASQSATVTTPVTVSESATSRASPACASPPPPPIQAINTSTTSLNPLEEMHTVHPQREEVRQYIVRRLPHLGRQNASEIDRWLKFGADPTEDIYPTVEHAISVKGGDIHVFRYFTRQIESKVTARVEQERIFRAVEEKYASV